MVCDDALAFLESLRDQCADIVFLDPPFNLGKRYGKRPPSDDRLGEDSYFKYMTRVLWRCKEVLRPGGALYLYHIPRWAIRLGALLEGELNFRHWIAVSMKNGCPRGKYLVPAHYALLYYTKGDPRQFSRPRIGIARCKCGRTIKDYGGYEKYVRDGLNLTDFWEDISPVRHRKFKHRSSNELPLRILSRVMEMSGVEGGLVVDPFAGAGTTLVAAGEGKMEFVACDKDMGAVRIIARRLTSAL